MKFLHIILISLLLVGCTPPVAVTTPTPAVSISAATSSPTAFLTPTSVSTSTSTPEPDPVLVGSGDIAHCRSEGDEITASLLDAIPGTVFTTGDNVYRDGSPEEFANCYDPSWGRHKERTYPSPGNHDYHTEDAAGYFKYFGSRAGEPGKGYYSYDLGTWHVIALNSNLSVEAGSPQDQWLRGDLAAHPVACTVAYWHHPRFSSGAVHGSDDDMEPLWETLYEYGADVVLVGHEHNYERFALQDPQGNADPARGIRQFVIGSGGRSHYEFETPIANSEVRNSNTSGLLKLTLHSGSYSWEFIPEPGKIFTDSGTAPCVTQ
ncbi:MAG: metallophosphoesterase [Chloroflexota bacterium]|nr:metallophosphoesterase [Chloroflexota bacterium]